MDQLEVRETQVYFSSRNASHRLHYMLAERRTRNNIHNTRSQIYRDFYNSLSPLPLITSLEHTFTQEKNQYHVRKGTGISALHPHTVPDSDTTGPPVALVQRRKHKYRRSQGNLESGATADQSGALLEGLS